MFKAQAIDFPFVKDVPVREKGRMAKVWDHFQALKAVVAEKGMIVPQHLVAELLGVSRQRVCVLTDEGRFEVVMVGGVRYLTERSVVEFAKEERKAGRPPKIPTTTTEILSSAVKYGKELRADVLAARQKARKDSR